MVSHQATIEVKRWMLNECIDQLDDLAEAYESGTDKENGPTYALTLSLQDLLNHPVERDEVDDDVVLQDLQTTTAKSPDDHPLTERVEEFVEDQLHERGIENASAGDDWRVCWTDPPESMVISPREDTANLVGQQVAVRGRIVHATKPKTVFRHVVFKCQRCGMTDVIPQSLDSDDLEEPHECPGCERQGPFAMLKQHENTRRVSTQYLRVEEVLGEQDSQSTPEDIDVRVYHASRTSQDWQRGEVVEVVGRVVLNTRSMPAESYIVASSVEPETDRQHQVEVTEENKAEIKEIIEDHGVLDAAEQSVASHIYGEDLAKQGLFLTMVGHSINDDPNVPLEDAPDLNAGLWGEPGTGKSELLEFVQKVHPKARRIDASGATYPGITAAADHEQIAGDSGWVVHPGVIPRASGGVVTMDELDKVEFPPSRLTDILWQNEVEINKGPIDAHIRTDVGVIAAGNPDDDYLDPHDDLKVQFDRFEHHLLDRFPLAYPFKRDLSDKDRQEGIKSLTADRYRPDSDDENSPTRALIGRELLQKWIYLARQQTPMMTSDAVTTIEETFGEFRQNNAEADGQGIDISNRRYDALFWLANAHARARLGDEVTEHDAEAAIHHMMQMLGEWGYAVEGESPFADEDDTAADDDEDDDGDGSDEGDDDPVDGTDTEDDRDCACEIRAYAEAHPDASVDEVLTQVDPPEPQTWETFVEVALEDARDNDEDDVRAKANGNGHVDPDDVLGEYRSLAENRADMTVEDVLAEYPNTFAPDVLDASEDDIRAAVEAVVNNKGEKV